VQARLPHASKQANGFEGNGFAPCIGPGNQQHKKIPAKVNVCGDNPVGVKQGVAAFADMDIPMVVKHRFGSVHGKCQFPFGKHEIQVGQLPLVGT
jgi:hypothetical protein